MRANVKRATSDDDLGWEDVGIFSRRVYASHGAYVQKQGEKLETRLGWCKKRDGILEQQLTDRLRELEVTTPGMAVLCLGARLGGEVRAFISLGCFAVGIDLNPGDGSRHVLHGDFHRPVFADDSIDLIYINCFDHCLEPKRLLIQIGRMLKPGGLLMMESKAGSGETERKPTGSDSWDCLEWPDVETLVAQVVRKGFEHVQSYHDRLSRAAPWGNVFRKVS